MMVIILLKQKNSLFSSENLAGTSAARPYREAHRATAFFQPGDRIKGHLYGNLFHDLIGKSWKIRENQGKSWKIKENHGKSRKIMENLSWDIYDSICCSMVCLDRSMGKYGKLMKDLQETIAAMPGNLELSCIFFLQPSMEVSSPQHECPLRKQMLLSGNLTVCY